MARNLQEIYARSIQPVFINPMGMQSTFMGNLAYTQSPYYKFSDRNFGLKREIPGLLDLAGLQASKTYSLDALERRNTLAEKYGRETEAFNLQLLEQGQAQEAFASRLLEQNERLAGIREGMPDAASAASSTRIYSQLAQSQMQNTARYLKELEAYKAPELPQIDFSFTNPITGEKMSTDTQFEDVYEEGDTPESVARQKVMDDFRKRRSEIMDEFLGESASAYGRVSDFLSEVEGYASAYGMTSEQALDRLYNVAGEKKRQYGWSSDWFDRFATQQEKTKQAYYDQYLMAVEREAKAEDFAEAQAIADMAGFTEFTVGMRNDTTFDAVAAFYGQDINKVLEDMIAGTTDRLTIARLGEREDFMREFNRRRERAMDQQELFNRQQRENQERAENMAQERRRVQQLFESQKREYETTMSSFGYTPDQISTGITFDDTRPM